MCGKSGVTCSRAIRISLGVSRLHGYPMAATKPQVLASLCLLVHDGQQYPLDLDSMGVGGGTVLPESDSALGTVSMTLWNLLPPELALSRC